MENKREEIKKEYYESAIRGDFQNETDLIDIDNVWNFFEAKITLIQSSLSKQKELVDEKNLTIEALQDQVRDKTIERDKAIKSGLNALTELQTEHFKLQSTIESKSARIKELEDVVVDLIEWEKTNHIEADLLARLKSLLTPSIVKEGGRG